MTTGYKVGDLCPDILSPATEGVFPIFNNGGFDILVIIETITEKNIKIFNAANKVKLRFLHGDNIPFLTLAFGNELELGLYLNIYRAEPRKIDAWLKLRVASEVDVYLVQQKDCIIKSTRTIPAGYFIKHVKKVLSKQHKQYGSLEEVEANLWSQFFRKKVIKMINKWN